MRRFGWLLWTGVVLAGIGWAPAAGAGAKVPQGKGFQELEKRIDGVDAALEEQIDALSEKLETLEGEIGDLGKELQDLEAGVGRLQSLENVAFATAVSQERSPADYEDLLAVEFTSMRDGRATVSFFGNVAQLNGFANTGLLFRIRVDGEWVGGLLRQDFESDRRTAQMIGLQWAVMLEAGPHEVALEWLGLTGDHSGENATIDSRALMVQHAD